MSKYNPYLAKNLSHVIDSLFIILVLALPFISYSFILNSNKIGKELYLVTVVSLWIVFKTVCTIKNKALKIYAVDVVMLLFYLYLVVHYFLFSFYTFLYDQFWVFTCYILLFYLFRWSYDKEQEKKILFNRTIYLIWCYCFVQSIAALLQNFDFINSDNKYFKTVGTFINPNFLGVYMVVGLLVLLYQILVVQEKKIVVKVALLLSFFSMLYILYLTESRASWISLIIGFLVLIFTSQNCVYFFKANKRKTIILFAIISIAVFTSLYLLYQLNKDSVDGRTLIRKIAVLDMQKNPFFGNGIFNFDGVYNDSKALYFTENQRPWKEVKVADYVSNALNDYIQIVFEIGLLGFVLLGVLLFIMVRKIELNPRTRFALAIVVAFVFLGLFTSVLYNPTAMVFMVWALSILFVYGDNKTQVFIIANNRTLNVLRGIIIFAFLSIGVLFVLKN
ncbi:O-antigen ligase [Flavobacterium sp. 81]|uniref:O-antigen ligase family protein n=1 Tax=Flavobacterium sp. 81 TaxID=2135621 RepID=UPI000EADA631|nr:O-antigen ligase family protein [Flavobacterium sp. 81]RKR08979.1 O-antigen ligase [Flavobacterium sp. 81]